MKQQILEKTLYYIGVISAEICTFALCLKKQSETET